MACNGRRADWGDCLSDVSTCTTAQATQSVAVALLDVRLSRAGGAGWLAQLGLSADLLESIRKATWREVRALGGVERTQQRSDRYQAERARRFTEDWSVLRPWRCHGDTRNDTCGI